MRIGINNYKCVFIANCMRKIPVIRLLASNIQVTISVMIQYLYICDKWNAKLCQLYWMKTWHVNSSVKILSLSPSHSNKAKEKLLAVLMHFFQVIAKHRTLCTVLELCLSLPIMCAKLIMEMDCLSLTSHSSMLTLDKYLFSMFGT